MLATQPNIDTIAITRTFDGIEAATHRVISQIGGMASVMREAKIAVLKPDLTIIDGSVGQDGERPLYGDKADLQVLVTGRDSLAYAGVRRLS